MSENIFNTVEVTAPNSNVFDLSHDVKFSAKFGNLVPISVMEAVPGDKFNIDSELFIRFAPMIAPVMHRYDVSIHYFFCPNRLTWPSWENFITGAKKQIPGYVPPAAPYFTYNVLNTQLNDGTITNYMGIPIITNTNAFNINALPFAAYNRIWFDYYRDQNLINSTDDHPLLNDGDNTGSMSFYTELRKRAWEHDYFTSALPFAQKGPPVYIPLGDVVLDNTAIPNQGKFRAASNQSTELIGGVSNAFDSGGTEVGTVVTNELVVYDPNGTLTVGATSINDLRTAYRLQEWLERNARGGTRYIESILAHFGVQSSDKRLQRPEYITGSKSPVSISEVLNTTGTDDAPQGQMAGHAIAVNNGNNASYYCEEHGYIIGIMSVMPKPAYQQGIPKHFLRLDPLEYAWPSFANLGEQEIINAELYADHPNPNGVFGYIPRYAEYRYQQNRVAGDFQTTLDFWHHGRIFANPPSLNQNFIECNPDMRVFAVQDGTDYLWCTVLNKVHVQRKLPKYATPIT